MNNHKVEDNPPFSSEYQLPSTELLNSYECDGEIDIHEEEVNGIKEHIEEIFHTLEVPIYGMRIDIASAVIRFVIITRANIRATFVMNVGREIGLFFNCKNIRASRPADGVIFIEVPRSKPGIVSLRSILGTKEFSKTGMELPIALGKTISNEAIVVDLTKIPHLIVAGSSWTGTTYAQHAIINSLLYKKCPDELKFVLIDMRMIDLNIYKPIAAHYLAAMGDDTIITDVSEATNTIRSVYTLTERRHALLRKTQSQDIKDYNRRYNRGKLKPADGHNYMPYIVVIIQEYADLALTLGKEIEIPLAHISELGSTVGVHILIVTRRTNFSFLTNIKRHLPGRMVFKVSSIDESQILLDCPDASQLLGRGDMLFLNSNNPIRVQCAYIDELEVERVCQHIARQPASNTPYLLPEPDEILFLDQKEDVNLSISNLDPFFEEAAHLIVKTQQGSVSMLQRQFSIGYNRAGSLMDQLESAGVVGPAYGAQPRDVFVTDENELKSIIEQMKADLLIKKKYGKGT